MPELPEVETTLRGIKPHIIGYEITEVLVRNKNLRWPVPRKVSSLGGSKINGIKINFELKRTMNKPIRHKSIKGKASKYRLCSLTLASRLSGLVIIRSISFYGIANGCGLDFLFG